jgi:hypothetical protein
MNSVRFLKKTAISSLHNINWLDFVMEMYHLTSVRKEQNFYVTA